MALPTWKELIDWIKPEPAAPDELKWAGNIKPGEYEIYMEKLNNICLEAKEVFVRAGVASTMIAGDNIVGIYTPAGDLVTCWCGTYLHAITAQLPIKFILKHYKDDPTVGINEGDVFYVNDAYYGGIHNGDEIAIMPVFHNGELIAWTTAAVHEPETGGCEPGGFPVTAKHKYDEGMRLPPIKIGTNYQLHDDMLEMIGNFLDRATRMCITDLRARVTGADRARVRLQQLAKEKGKEFVLGLFRKMIMDAEEGTRQRLRSWNDGIYRAVIFCDNVGVIPYLLRICITAHKEGDHITVDFTGTSPENHSFSHSTLAAVIAHAATYIYAYPFFDLPVSCGTFAPFDWIAPEGTVYNPTPNAGVANSVGICAATMAGMPIIFSKMMFDSEQRLQVGPSGGVQRGGCPLVAGVNQWGVPIADLHGAGMNTMGHAARSDQDGVDVYGFAWCHPGRIPDIEETEAEWPILHLMQKMRKDSGGVGKYRGGNAGEHAFTPYGVPYAVFACFSGSLKVPCVQGLFGGYPGTVGTPAIRISKSQLLEMMAKGERGLPSTLSELATQRAIKGDYEFISAMTPAYPAMTGESFAVGLGGGSGYGDVLERDAEAVVEDLRKEVISHWAAANVYHVAYDPHSLKVDYEKTKELQQKVRQQRLKQGKNYEEFEKEWLQKKPKDEILEWYGSWPDAKPVKPIMRM